MLAERCCRYTHEWKFVNEYLSCFLLEINTIKKKKSKKKKWAKLKKVSYVVS